jgi:hypothetical protein
MFGNEGIQEFTGSSLSGSANVGETDGTGVGEMLGDRGVFYKVQFSGYRTNSFLWNHQSHSF